MRGCRGGSHPWAALEPLERRLLLSGDVLITELLAINDSCLPDQDGAFSDWIELHNSTAADVNLAGWSLTDDPDELDKWTFPSVNLPAGGYLVVFASDKDRTDPAGELHANFKLKGEGEYLGLVRPDLTVEHEYAPRYPAQWTDISYGLGQGKEAAVEGFFATPTPGAPNGVPDNSGPAVDNVTDDPPRPLDNQDLVITAEVAQRFAPVGQVLLHYVVMFGAESAVPMADNGLGADQAAGDGVYTAVIPAAASGPGQMVRWYVTADDVNGRDSRQPLHVDPLKAPDYFGTVVFDPAADPAKIKTPVLEWFVEDMTWREFMLTEANYYTWKDDPANWGDAFLYYNGRFYSGVRVRVRGAYTLYAGSNYQLRKLKFEMPDGQWFQYDPDQSPVEEFNIQMFFTDQTDRMREPLAADVFALAGVPTFQCFHIHLRNNGAFYGPAAFVEQVDQTFLERVGLDPDGALYKPTGPQLRAPVSQSDLRPDWMNPYGVYRKCTRRDEDWSDFDALRDGLVLPPAGDELRRFLFDNIDLAEVVNYMAASALMLHCDRCEKNYYMYRDTEGDGEWSILPWDMELALERGKIDNPRYNSIDFGDYNNHSWLDWDYGPTSPHTGLYIDSYNRLYDAILRMPETRQMYLRRLRTLMDTILEPSGGTTDAMVAWYKSLAGGNGSTVLYGLNQRRTQLFGNAEIPAAQAGSPAILFGTIEYAPASGDPDEQYVQLHNPNAFAVDVSGWRLAGAVDFTFAPGTVIGAGASLYVSPDLPSFRARTAGPGGDQGVFVVGGHDDYLVSDGQRLWLLDAAGAQIDTAFVGDEAVVINEIFAGGDGGVGDWIELRNLTGQPVDVGGWTLSDRLDDPAPWTIPAGTTIDPGGYVVFNQRDDFGGAFGLDRSGERVVLGDAGGAVIDAQEFGNADPGVTFGRYVGGDGADFVALSAATMGGANAAPLVGPVVINEIMYHPLDGEEEFIELHNITGETVALYDLADPGRTWAVAGAVEFSFPAGAEIPAGGFAVVVGVDLSDPADEAAFRDRYGIPAEAVIHGPYTGRLDNAGESVELTRPAAGGGADILVDRVAYDDTFPWPEAADGTGPSLERIRPDRHGDESGNWAGVNAGGSPGAANMLPNTGPQADAGADLDIYLPSPALLAGAAEDDGLPVPPGTLTLTWETVAGPGQVTFDDSHAPATTAWFALPGTYVLRLTAADGELSDSDEVTVVVGPALEAAADADVTSGRSPLTVSFSGAASPPLGGRKLVFRWDFGDGSGTWAQNPSHTYETYGQYQAELTVTDGVRQGTAAVTVVVGAFLGDANGDGRVGVADLVALADNYGKGDAAWVDGDFTGDGLVGIADLGALADNYGHDATGGQTTSGTGGGTPAGADQPPADAAAAAPADGSVTADRDADAPAMAAVPSSLAAFTVKPASATPAADPLSPATRPRGLPTSDAPALDAALDVLSIPDLIALTPVLT